MFKHLHNLSLQFHLNRQTGALAKYIDRGTKGIDFLLRYVLFNVVPTFFEIFLVSGILFYLYGPWYAVVTLTTIGLYSYLTFQITEWRNAFRKRMNQADNDISTKMIDSLLNFETVKYFNNENYDINKWELAMNASLDAINTAIEQGSALYEFTDTPPTFDTENYEYEIVQKQYDVRYSIVDRWNNELLWGHSNPVGTNWWQLQAGSLMKSPTSSSVEAAPIINNRKVQSFVRVANNTPFIIGGLINKKTTLNDGGVPILKDLPLIGRLFAISSEQTVKKEVIVVITPHIITDNEDNFSRVIPQDSELFNAFGNRSFPNSYRLQHSDVFDLSFIFESPVFKEIKEEVNKRAEKDKTLLVRDPYKSLIEGKIPGENILVRRMLIDVIERLGYHKHIDPAKVIYFLDSESDPAGFRVSRLANDIIDMPPGQALQLSYSIKGKATVQKPFVRPTAETKYITLSDSYKNVLKGLNKRGSDPSDDVFTILISQDKEERRLYDVLVMKKVLEMNPDLELTLQYFKPGIEILFPSPDVLLNNNHVVDRDAAKYFYEANDYYGSFEEEFNRSTAELGRLIQGRR